MNHGIMQAYDRGIVTSASVLVGGDHAEAGVQEAAERPDLSLGLHLAFIQANPICSPVAIPSLIGASGELRPSAMHLVARPPAVSDLWREASAQLRRFRELVGRPPDFVNTHQHTQVVPQVMMIMRRLCARHGVPRARLAAEQNPFRVNKRPRSWLWPAVTAISRLGRPLFERADIRTPERMVGGPESGRLTRRALQMLIRDLKPGVSELVVHPRLGSEELAALTDPATANLLSVLGVSTMGFDEL